MPFSWNQPEPSCLILPMQIANRTQHDYTMAPIRQSRPVSAATDLTDFTDFTHATDEPIEADVCCPAPPPDPRLELS